MDTEAKEARVVKRYANRKLYDTHESRYVTLQQIAEFVRAGEDVRIIDNRTKEDLTSVTLAQIIYEEERKGDGETRRSTLKSLIEQGRERLVGSLPPQITKFLQPEGDESRKSFPAMLEDFRAEADDRVKGVLGAAVGHVQQLQTEIRRLQGRIEDLEGKLASMLRREERQREDKSRDAG